MFDLQHKTKFPVIFVVGCIAVLTASFLFNPTDRLSVVISLLTAVGGTTAFLYSKHSRDTELFIDLFRNFNARYDKLNERLNEIYNRPPDVKLTAVDRDILCDYFNLCAEEYLFGNAGFIDVAVWRAWQAGMSYFAKDPEILDFWRNELEQGSYYGFTIFQ